jgi:hypothetical protein
MAALVLLFILLALCAGSLSGRTPDSRDREYDLRPLIGRRSRP